MACKHIYMRLDRRSMIFERMWYEWNAGVEMNVAGWCNDRLNYRGVILVRMWDRWDAMADIPVASWCKNWSDWRSVVRKWTWEREVVVRVNTRFPRARRCWTRSRGYDRRTAIAGYISRCGTRDAYPEQRRRIGC